MCIYKDLHYKDNSANCEVVDSCQVSLLADS